MPSVRWARGLVRLGTIASGAAASSAALCERAPPVGSGSDPKAPDLYRARRLAERWTRQEADVMYKLPDGRWPPMQPAKRADIPALRRALDECGGVDRRECQEIGFALATTLLGGTLYGHATQESERGVDEMAQGAQLMRSLADRGSVDGACGWAYVLYNGDAVPADEKLAAEYFEQVNPAGFEAAPHQRPRVDPTR